MSDTLAQAAEIMPLYRQAHFDFITFAERGAKVLLLDVSEIDIREFELSAARVEDSMRTLQETVRRTWEAARKIEDGLARETVR